MEQIDFSVRLLSGKIQSFTVPADTPVSDIVAEMQTDLPEFHEVHLINGIERLEGGIVSDVRFGPEKVLQVITCVSTAAVLSCLHSVVTGGESPNEKALDLFEDVNNGESFAHNSSSLIQFFPCIRLSQNSRTHFIHLRRIILRSMHILSEFGNLSDAAELQKISPNVFLGDRGWPLLEILQTVTEIEARCTAPQESHQHAEQNRSDLSSGAVATANTMQDPQVSHELEIAIRESVATAQAEEGADVLEAVLRSKIEAVQRQQLVVLRLTKRNANVAQALLEDPRLCNVREHVVEAGCEMFPDWGDGFISLAPLTEQQVSEAGVTLRAHHIVVAQQDQSLVQQVLGSIPKRQGRPVVHLAAPEHLNTAADDPVTAEPSNHVKEPEPQTQTCPVVNLASPARLNAAVVDPEPAEARNYSEKPQPPPYIPDLDFWDGLWDIERTFVHCPLPSTMSSSSRAVRSEPWGGLSEDGPLLKLRRLAPEQL